MNLSLHGVVLVGAHAWARDLQGYNHWGQVARAMPAWSVIRGIVLMDIQNLL
jgi:hypothetical protein